MCLDAFLLFEMNVENFVREEKLNKKRSLHISCYSSTDFTRHVIRKLEEHETIMVRNAQYHAVNLLQSI
jgi:queuine/archaeosine tRNA-ribosyltransferase